jgi:FkbM family methyltransferase
MRYLNVLLRKLNIIFWFLSNIPYVRDFPIVFIDKEGNKFYAKVQDYWRFSVPFEPLTYRFLIHNVERNDVFLDIGAHIGLYSIRLAQRVSKVIALEPEPRNYGLLSRNIHINKLYNKILPLPVAASDKNGRTELCVKSSSGDHTIEDLRGCKMKIQIATLKIDTLTEILKISRIDVVKIDVEGHENKVVNGMRELLYHNTPRVLVIETKRENKDLFEIFSMLGYKIIILDCWDSPKCNYGFYMVK